MKIESQELVLARLKKSESGAKLLQRIKLFSELPFHELKNLAHLAIYKTYKEGEEVRHQDEGVDEAVLYIVEQYVDIASTIFVCY